jgi:uncharacterized membrane protein YhhN
VAQAYILGLAVILSASISIRAEYRGLRQQNYIFKPLTMVLIWLIALLGQATSPLYKVMIFAGLVFSMAGDLLLILPSDRFAAGLAAFLFAHLFYSAAFVSEIRTPTWWPTIPLLAYGVVVYLLLAPSLGKLKLPVLLYVVAILAMAWFAWERWSQSGSRGALSAFVGAVLFVISDTVLAFNHFRLKSKAALAVSLATYWAAQWLVARSVGA